MRSVILLTLLLTGAALAGPAPDLEPELHVTPRRHQGTLYLGLTPLGTTPLRTPLPVGRALPLTLYAAGFHPAQRRLTIGPGETVTWSPLLRPPLLPPSRDWPADVPPWVRTPCRSSPCGLGTATHFSPMMARTLAIGRALTEAARTQDLRVSLIDASYREHLGSDLRTASQQRTDVRWAPGYVQVWQAGQRSIARVGPGPAAPAIGLGAPNRLWPSADAVSQARLAALVSALRWHHTWTGPVHSSALVRTFGDGLEDGRYLEDARAIRIHNAQLCGTLHAELRDHQRLIQAPGGRPPARTWSADRVELQTGPFLIELRDGVPVDLHGGTARQAYQALSQCLREHGLSVRTEVQSHPDGGVLATTHLQAQPRNVLPAR
jgi:hypothetical protein